MPSKKLSNPISTGGAGVIFETHVQSSFAVLMLTRGVAPCLPSWPIIEINLQGGIDGYKTDDLIVTVESQNGEKRKLLGQVKLSISVTKSDSKFGQVIQAAWDDFCNPSLFEKGKDIIALITGPLSATDESNVKWLFEQARSTKDADEFLRHVMTAYFSSKAKMEKFDVIKNHLKNANNNRALSNEELYDFFKSFYFLGYDLGAETGVVLSLIQSHLSLFQKNKPEQVWKDIVYFVQNNNRNAGTLTRDSFPDDIHDLFVIEKSSVIPEQFEYIQTATTKDWNTDVNATLLAQLSLIGSWDEKSEFDTKVLSTFFGESYDELIKKVREILYIPNSPILFKDKQWKILNRLDLLNNLGSRILDSDLNKLKSAVISVLTECDASFGMDVDERFLASLSGNSLNHSELIRSGLLKGLAILNNNPNFISSISKSKINEICDSTVHGLLTNIDYKLWGSLDDQLPLLAEISPNVVMNKIEESLKIDSSLFAELYSQEGSIISGRSYLIGTLFALESLAWDKTYHVRTCVALAGLANIDPNSKGGSRPLNSLVTILLPWFPQTMATIEKRFVALETVYREFPVVGWELLLKLLPGQQRSSSGSYKPKYRQVISREFKKEVTADEYFEQSEKYSEFAIHLAKNDPVKIVELVDFISHFTENSFVGFLEVLSSDFVTELPENEKMLIWKQLNILIRRHKKSSKAKWALSKEKLSELENRSENLSPADSFNLHQNLFSSLLDELVDFNGDLAEQKKSISDQRVKAINEIFAAGGLTEVFHFASLVKYPREVGIALAELDSSVDDNIIYPSFLNSTDRYKVDIASSYSWRKNKKEGLSWVDGLDKSTWSKEQIGLFLANLPFTQEILDRVDEWLDRDENLFWEITSANPYDSDESLNEAIDKLLQYKRPLIVLKYLYRKISTNLSIDTNQCVKALNDTVSHQGSIGSMDVFHIQEVIKFLQKNNNTSEDDLIRIEWLYLSYLKHGEGLTLSDLRHSNESAPITLKAKLSMDSKFFSELIQLVYRPKDKDAGPKVEKSIAINGMRLLREWKTIPGTNKNGEFNERMFLEWFDGTLESCSASGHLEVALIKVGEVLIYSPPDPDGLWINKRVAEKLNDSSYDELRRGYYIGKLNSRGVRWVHPDGMPEKELSEEFKTKAECVEDLGYQRFAKVLRDLANTYLADAER